MLKIIQVLMPWQNNNHILRVHSLKMMQASTQHLTLKGGQNGPDYPFHRHFSVSDPQQRVKNAVKWDLYRLAEGSTQVEI